MKTSFTDAIMDESVALTIDMNDIRGDLTPLINENLKELGFQEAKANTGLGGLFTAIRETNLSAASVLSSMKKNLSQQDVTDDATQKQMIFLFTKSLLKQRETPLKTTETPATLNEKLKDFTLNPQLVIKAKRKSAIHNLADKIMKSETRRSNNLSEELLEAYWQRSLHTANQIFNNLQEKVRNTDEKQPTSEKLNKKQPTSEKLNEFQLIETTNRILSTKTDLLEKHQEQSGTSLGFADRLVNAIAASNIEMELNSHKTASIETLACQTISDELTVLDLSTQKQLVSSAEQREHERTTSAVTYSGATTQLSAAKLAAFLMMATTVMAAPPLSSGVASANRRAGGGTLAGFLTFAGNDRITSFAANPTRDGYIVSRMTDTELNSNLVSSSSFQISPSISDQQDRLVQFLNDKPSNSSFCVVGNSTALAVRPSHGGFQVLSNGREISCNATDIGSKKLSIFANDDGNTYVAASTLVGQSQLTEVWKLNGDSFTLLNQESCSNVLATDTAKAALNSISIQSSDGASFCTTSGDKLIVASQHALLVMEQGLVQANLGTTFQNMMSMGKVAFSNEGKISNIRPVLAQLANLARYCLPAIVSACAATPVVEGAVQVSPTPTSLAAAPTSPPTAAELATSPEPAVPTSPARSSPTSPTSQVPTTTATATTAAELAVPTSRAAAPTSPARSSSTSPAPTEAELATTEAPTSPAPTEAELAVPTSRAAAPTSPARSSSTSPAPTEAEAATTTAAELATSPEPAVPTSPEPAVPTSPARSSSTSPAPTEAELATSPEAAVPTSPARSSSTSPAPTEAEAATTAAELATSPEPAVPTSPEPAVPPVPTTEAEAATTAAELATSPEPAVPTSPVPPVPTSSSLALARSSSSQVPTSSTSLARSSSKVPTSSSPAPTSPTSPTPAEAPTSPAPTEAEAATTAAELAVPTSSTSTSTSTTAAAAAATAAATAAAAAATAATAAATTPGTTPKNLAQMTKNQFCTTMETYLKGLNLVTALNTASPQQLCTDIFFGGEDEIRPEACDRELTDALRKAIEASKEDSSLSDQAKFDKFTSTLSDQCYDKSQSNPDLAAIIGGAIGGAAFLGAAGIYVFKSNRDRSLAERQRSESSSSPELCVAT